MNAPCPMAMMVSTMIRSAVGEVPFRRVYYVTT